MISATKPKAVVVEDDVTVAGMVCYFLELQGITCFHALTAESGWRTIVIETPAMAVIDQRLPGRDGSWLLERIREDDRFSQLPVVLISGYEDAAVATRAKELGSPCLAKPFSYDQLNSRLAEAADLAMRWEPD
jgi:two-component system KDP operon response regulator KdpE